MNYLYNLLIVAAGILAVLVWVAALTKTLDKLLDSVHEGNLRCANVYALLFSVVLAIPTAALL